MVLMPYNESLPDREPLFTGRDSVALKKWCSDVEGYWECDNTHYFAAIKRYQARG